MTDYASSPYVVPTIKPNTAMWSSPSSYKNILDLPDGSFIKDFAILCNNNHFLTNMTSWPLGRAESNHRLKLHNKPCQFCENDCADGDFCISYFAGRYFFDFSEHRYPTVPRNLKTLSWLISNPDTECFSRDEYQTLSMYEREMYWEKNFSKDVDNGMYRMLHGIAFVSGYRVETQISGADSKNEWASVQTVADNYSNQVGNKGLALIISQHPDCDLNSQVWLRVDFKSPTEPVFLEVRQPLRLSAIRPITPRCPHQFIHPQDYRIW